jgi:hypothetical protein
MSAAEILYDAIHEAIAEAVAADASDISAFELIGVIEQVKHDLLTAGDLDDDSEELAAA